MKTPLELVRSVLEEEAQALTRLKDLLDGETLSKVAELFLSLKQTGNHLVITGVGKSGLIGQKMASSFCSLGLRSYFLHPVEALHGDLGRVDPGDVLLMISKSGTTEEILKLVPYVEIPKERRIGFLGNLQSPLGKECGLLVDCSVEKEACLNNQAPTTSTTVALAMGDALAVLFESLTGLSREGFAQNHPGGILGKALRLKVHHLMVAAESCPQVGLVASLREVILEMTKFPVGLCAVVSPDKDLLGVITEGDIRRAFLKEVDLGKSLGVKEVMNSTPIVVPLDTKASEALGLMETNGKQIYQVPVVLGTKFQGVLRMHDLVREGLI